MPSDTRRFGRIRGTESNNVLKSDDLDVATGTGIEKDVGELGLLGCPVASKFHLCGLV